jgi:hypothetical protein
MHVEFALAARGIPAAISPKFMNRTGMPCSQFSLAWLLHPFLKP